MDKDFYIFVKQDEPKSASGCPQPQSTRHIGTSTLPQKAAMQPTTPVQGPHTNSNVPEPPLLRRRQITIGGPDRPMEIQKESSSRSNAHGLSQVPLALDHVIGVHNRLQPTSSTAHQGGTTATRSTKRAYPPTSWKSTSTVDSVTLDQRISSGIRAAESDAPLHAGERPEAAELVVDKTIAAVEDPKSKKIVTPEKPARTGSRRQYTIGSSTPTHQAEVPPSEGRKTKSSHSLDRVAVRRPVLPDPETAYAHTFHYTTCPHTSPPKARPLNVQPTLVRYHDGLLAHPPSNLVERRDNSESDPLNVYILEGPCSDCDLSARRRAESAILDTYNHKLENLTIQLSLLQRDIASEHPQVLANRHSDAFSTFTLPSTLELTPEVTQSILEIEDQLNELIKNRDREVKQVFKGFTARWGPGTAQIHRDDSVQIPVRSRSRSTASSTTSFHIPSVDTTPEKSVTETSTTSGGANRTLPPSRKSSFATQTRATSTQERYSDGTHDVFVDSSVDGIKGRGRMLVDWIRPAQRENEPDGRNDMPRRKSSRQGK